MFNSKRGTLNKTNKQTKKTTIYQPSKQGKGQVIGKSLLGLERVRMNVFSCVLELPPSEGCEQLDAQEASRSSLFLLLSL